MSPQVMREHLTDPVHGLVQKLEAVGAARRPLLRHQQGNRMHIIHTEANGALAVNAVATMADGTDVDGHCYRVVMRDPDPELTESSTWVRFQQGGVAERGVNGLTNEALLAILIHRTEVLNKRFPCEENDLAIRAMEEALGNFNVRTKRRLARGVEGKQVA